MAYMRMESKKVHICISDVLGCTAEMNTLLINYTPVKSNFKKLDNIFEKLLAF